MLKIGDKEYRNIQEQVEKNKQDIEYILEEEGALNEFGIRVVGEIESTDDLPSVADYKEDNENWEYGDTYAIGTEPPYTLYVLTRANGTHPNDYWFVIGQFPMPGPTGQDGTNGKSIVYSSFNISHTIGFAVHTIPSVYPMVEKVGDLVIDSAGYLGECTTLTENVIEINTKSFIGGAPGQNGNNIRYYSGDLNTVIDNYTQISEDYSVGDVVVSSNGYLGTVTSKSTSYVMVQTKASLVGPQGPSGTSDKGLYITSVEPTEDGGVYTLSSGNLDNVNANVTIQPNDIIIYIDGNEEPTYMYQVVSVSGTTITVQPVAAYAKGGSQLYSHNICIYRNDADIRTYIYFNIITSSSAVMTLADTISLLQSRSYTDNILRAYSATGFYINFGVTTPTVHPVVNVHVNASLNTQLYYGFVDGTNSNPSLNSTLISTSSTKYTFTDIVNEV